MIFEPKDAKQLLVNATVQAFEHGKELLGEAWDKFTPDERLAFEATVSALAKARVAELAGLPEARDLCRTLEVALNEWKLAGKTEVLRIIREVAKEVLGIGTVVAGGLLRGLILGL